ncbi:hypothetical protein VQH23_25485 [Pararoseomonas sp. SCSIO 73927]|uniref:hypothetical protein n=1 Tax=Pararoseomonas sp. SCSIO 73927 TaxID=3114537 RepID=UPI0030CA64A6
MDSDKTDQKRDHETGHWVSDLKPDATPNAKVEKALEDTFPASDPAVKSGTTGFISPEGEDTGASTEKGEGGPGSPSGGKP